MKHPSLIVTALLLSTAAAQSVGVSLDAQTPLTIQVTSNTQSPVNSTWPIGPMGPSGSISASLPGGAGAGGSLTWQTYAQSYYAQARVTTSLSGGTSQPSFHGQIGAHEIVATFTSATARDAEVHLSRSASVATGTPWPSVDIDVDNDGTFEIVDLQTWANQPIPVSFGPQPLEVRIVYSGSAQTLQGFLDIVTVTLLPDNDLTIQTPVLGCRPVSPPPPPLLHPSFDNRGIDLLMYPSAAEPSVLVLSLNAQPTMLSMSGTLPCLLLPAPDVVLLATGAFHLGLPASVRPATVYAQGVTLTSSGLIVTDGYAVTAH